ncbi:putative glutaredoxin, Thioredoxin-like superfamily [Helianthus annuus]|nr:putative glutaredoxin, Thioredoxin-like superfamily [Helianthus annuus]
MKSVKGKLLKKLKTIKTIGYLKPERILHVNAADGLIENILAKSSDKVEENHLLSDKEVMQVEKQSSFSVEESVEGPEIIDVSELMKDLEEDDDGSDMDSDDVDDKENYRPKSDKNPVNRNSNSFGATPLKEIDISSFRAPNLDSGTLFDPNLLAAFQQAVLEVKAQEGEKTYRGLHHIGDNLDNDQDSDAEPQLKSMKLEDIDDPLSEFERICPPGGSDSVILYTTGFRSVRKTFEDCSSIRFLLESFKVLYHERDLSMHLDFRDELWRILGRKVVPPRLFIKGRYIGGAEEVLRLHEQGKFRPLLAGIPVNMFDGPCEGCAGVRFVVCFSCSGSRKVGSGDGWLPEKCRECNENGLIMCPFCS